MFPERCPRRVARETSSAGEKGTKSHGSDGDNHRETDERYHQSRLSVPRLGGRLVRRRLSRRWSGRPRSRSSSPNPWPYRGTPGSVGRRRWRSRIVLGRLRRLLDGRLRLGFGSLPLQRLCLLIWRRRGNGLAALAAVFLSVGILACPRTLLHAHASPIRHPQASSVSSVWVFPRRRRSSACRLPPGPAPAACHARVAPRVTTPRTTRADSPTLVHATGCL